MRWNTCAVENSVYDGAVLKQGVCRPDVFKETVFKVGLYKPDIIHLDANKPVQHDAQ